MDYDEDFDDDTNKNILDRLTKRRSRTLDRRIVMMKPAIPSAGIGVWSRIALRGMIETQTFEEMQADRDGKGVVLEVHGTARPVAICSTAFLLFICAQ